MDDRDFSWLGKPYDERPEAESEHLATFWTLHGLSGRDIVCAAFRVATGLELRTSYSQTEIIGTKLFRGPLANEQLAEAADQWRANMLAKGFRETTIKTKTGLVCPQCRQPVAIIENRTERSLLFQCPECGIRWSAEETGTKAH